MPVLKNVKHEIFAQELAKGETCEQAFINAGYSPNPGNASRLKGYEKINDRVAEIIGRSATNTLITLESLLIEANVIQQKALESGQLSAANGALKLKAELSGYYVQRKEDVTPRRNIKDIDTRLREILGAREAPGNTRTAGGAGAGSPGDETFPTVPGHGTA